MPLNMTARTSCCSHLLRAGYFTHPPTGGVTLDQSCSAAIVVMETTQDRQGDYGPLVLAWIRRLPRYKWNRLIDALMRPGVIEVAHTLAEDPAKLTFVEDEEVVQALPVDTPEEAFTHGICPWSYAGVDNFMRLAPPLLTSQKLNPRGDVGQHTLPVDHCDRLGDACVRCAGLRWQLPCRGRRSTR